MTISGAGTAINFVPVTAGSLCPYYVSGTPSADILALFAVWVAMVVGNAVQDVVEAHRDALERRVFQEGMELWKRQKEFERDKRIKEQREIREMLDNYWPWGRGTDAKPRGLRNLRLEELFPNKDYEKAKRFVGTLDIGRGGGGAPLVNSGRKVTRTREDPILRFQFGSKDLRRCVDNTLRYKTSKENQREYKKELGNV